MSAISQLAEKGKPIPNAVVATYGARWLGKNMPRREELLKVCEESCRPYLAEYGVTSIEPGPSGTLVRNENTTGGNSTGVNVESTKGNKNPAAIAGGGRQ